MYFNFEIAALFPSPYSRVKKHGKFKTNIHLDSVESFLYNLSSRPSLYVSFRLIKITFKVIPTYYGNIDIVTPSLILPLSLERKSQCPILSPTVLSHYNELLWFCLPIRKIHKKEVCMFQSVDWWASRSFQYANVAKNHAQKRGLTLYHVLVLFYPNGRWWWCPFWITFA